MSTVLPAAILLDLDDTRLDDSGGIPRRWQDACTSCAPALGGIAPAALYDAIERTRAWFWADPARHRRGRLDLEAAAQEVVALALHSCGADDVSIAGTIAERYRVQREAGLELFPGADDTVRWLRQRGCRLALITNGNAETQRRKVVRFALADLFDTILIEGEMGFGKPDPRIYDHALRALDVAASDCWMVGDNLEWDVAQPQALGMRGVWVDARGAGLRAGSAVRPDRILRSVSELRLPA